MDIQTRKDIEQLVDVFYEKVKKNERIGYIFNEITPEKWNAHVDVIYSFWDSVLLGAMTYRGNVMMKHIELDKEHQLNKMHFETWEKLFLETVNELFEGKKAEEAKKRAKMMGQLMLFKVENSRNKNFIQ